MNLHRAPSIYIELHGKSSIVASTAVVVHAAAGWWLCNNRVQYAVGDADSALARNPRASIAFFIAERLNESCDMLLFFFS